MLSIRRPDGPPACSFALREILRVPSSRIRDPDVAVHGVRRRAGGRDLQISIVCSVLTPAIILHCISNPHAIRCECDGANLNESFQRIFDPQNGLWSRIGCSGQDQERQGQNGRPERCPWIFETHSIPPELKGLKHELQRKLNRPRPSDLVERTNRS